MIVDDKKIAEHFNLIFSNLGQYSGSEYQSAPIYKAGDESFSFCPIIEKWYDVLKKMNPYKPTGPCEVPAWAIDGRYTLVLHLTFVLNECIKDCVFPAMLTTLFSKIL